MTSPLGTVRRQRVDHWPLRSYNLHATDLACSLQSFEVKIWYYVLVELYRSGGNDDVIFWGGSRRGWIILLLSTFFGLVTLSWIRSYTLQSTCDITIFKPFKDTNTRLCCVISVAFTLRLFMSHLLWWNRAGWMLYRWYRRYRLNGIENRFVIRDWGHLCQGSWVRDAWQHA